MRGSDPVKEASREMGLTRRTAGQMGIDHVGTVTVTSLYFSPL